MKKSKPEFKRQESWRYKRVAENWRRPRGVTSKMRKEEAGFPAKAKVGYGSAASSRGLHPRGLVDKLVWRETDLETLDPNSHIVRIAHRVGEKKRLGIVEKAKEHNFHIANPGKEEGRPISEEPVTDQAAASTEDSETSTAIEEPSETLEAAETPESPAGEEDSE